MAPHSRLVSMIDESYDRSANMRLLELQRKALGLPARVIGSTSYTDPDPLADVVGFGCAALRVSALRSMAPPLFNTQVYVEEQAARVRICNENYLFCEEARRGGWLVAVHSGIRCKHYDRVSSIAYPREWEDPSATNVERMLVEDPGPSYRVVPYDTTRPTKRERHETASVDYIVVDCRAPRPAQPVASFTASNQGCAAAPAL
jgi:hypothetical protein